MIQNSAQAERKHAAPDLEESILLVLVLLEPLVFTPFTRNPFAAKELVLAASLVGLAIARLAAVRKGQVFCRPPVLLTAGLLALSAVHAVLAALSPDRAASAAFIIRMFGGLSLFVLVASRSWDARFFRRLFTAVLVGILAAGIYGLLQAARLDPVAWADTFRVAGASLGTMRMFSTFGHPNFFGSHLAAAFFLVTALALLAERPLPRALAAAGIVLDVSCLLLTLNRGAWVGVLAAAGSIALLAWQSVRRGGPLRREAVYGCVAKSRGLAVIAGLTLLAVLMVTAGSPQLRQRLAVSPDEPTVKSRLLIWEGALKMIRDRPLAGFGQGTFGRVFPFYRDERLSKFHDELVPVTHAHNEYLEIAAETGMIGLAATLTFLAVVLHRGILKLHDAPSREEWITTGAVLAGAISILVGSLFGVELRYVNASFFLWLLLGLLAAQVPCGEGNLTAKCSRWASFATTAVVCLGALLLFQLALGGFVGEIHLQRGEEFLASGSLQSAATEGRTAAAWNRTDPAGLLLAGEALARGKDYAAAHEAYREVETINPGEPLIGYNLALMDYLQGNYDAALGSIEAARKLAPRHEPSRSLHYDLWLKKGLSLVKRGDLDGAKAAFRSAGRIGIGIGRRDPSAVFYLGNVHALEHDFPAAADRYRKALEIDPTFLPAAENLKKIEAPPGR